MPTIEFSPALTVAQAPRLFNHAQSGTTRSVSSVASYYANNGNTNAASGCVTQFLKGTMPSSFTGLGPLTRSSDVLVTFRSQSASAFPATPLIVYNGIDYMGRNDVNPVIISTSYVNASASGICTWFLHQVVNTSGSILNGFMGTVGVVGSGADLEIDDVNIVSGQQYRILNLRIQIPNIWTF